MSPATITSGGRTFFKVLDEIPPDPQTGVGAPARYVPVPPDGKEYFTALAPAGQPLPPEPQMIAFAP